MKADQELIASIVAADNLFHEDIMREPKRLMTRSELSENLSGNEKQTQDAIHHGLPNESIAAYLKTLISLCNQYIEEHNL